MSQIKRYLESQQFSPDPEDIPNEFERKEFGFTEINFEGLKLKQMLFRHKNFDSSDVLNQFGVKHLTAITYLVGSGFSQSLLTLVKQAAPDLDLKIAFTFTDDSGNNPKARYPKSNINKLIKAFRQLFDSKQELSSIETIITTDNHIKLLQFDDQLMIGSMNLSGSADGLTKEKLLKNGDGTPRPNFRKHELICCFSGNAQSVANQVINKLSGTENAVTLNLKRHEYDKQLINTCSKLKHSLLVDSETIEYYQSEQIKDQERLQDSIRTSLETILSAFLSRELDINSINAVESYDYEDLVILHSLIADYQAQDLIEFIQDYACFISKDLDELPEICEEIQMYWNGAIEQLTDSCLDLEKIRESILEERYDNNLDDGEGEPVFGLKSQEIYHRECETLHKELEENLLEICKDIYDIGNKVATLIYDNELYKLD
ncbi:TPA: hypothetical protein ACX6RK_001057 [Photobacterium damselae]